MAADLGCTEESKLSELIDYGFFTSYVLKLTPHVSEVQSLSIFRIASFKTNNSGNDIYAEALCLEEGRLKAGTDTGPQNFIARYISIHTIQKVHKVHEF